MKLLAAATWIFVALSLNACSVFNDMHSMKNKTNDMNDNTREMKDTTNGMAQNTAEMKNSTADMAKTTNGMAENTAEMKNSTAAMAKTTDDMAKKTTEMAATTAALSTKTDALKAEMSHLYRDLRQGDAMRNRADAIKAMSETTDQVAKLSYAGHYFMAFEFQLWKNFAEDDAAALDAMRRDAVDEFLREVHRFIPTKPTLSPVSDVNSMQDLYALVAAMHSVNSNSLAEVPASAGGMLELLRQGLAAKVDVEQGKISLKDLPAYKFKVLQSEDEVLYLLNMRANFLPAMVMTQLASSDGHALNRDEMVAALTAPWEAQVDGKNMAELAVFGGLMQQTMGTVQILKSVGAKPMIDDNFRALVKQVTFAPASYGSANADRNKLVMQLQGALKAYAAQ